MGTRELKLSARRTGRYISRKAPRLEEMADHTWLHLVVDAYDFCVRHARLVYPGHETQASALDEGDFLVSIGRGCGVTMQRSAVGMKQVAHDVRYTFSSENHAAFVRTVVSPVSGRVVDRACLTYTLSSVQRVAAEVNQPAGVWFLVDPVPAAVRAAAAVKLQELARVPAKEN